MLACYLKAKRITKKRERKKKMAMSREQRGRKNVASDDKDR